MKTFSPNFVQQDGLHTVLEVPIPEETFPTAKTKWSNVKNWIKSNPTRNPNRFPFPDRTSQIQLLLGVVGVPLIPLPITSDHWIDKSIKDHPIESSMAKYIVHQYIAAVGGDHALNLIDSMYAMGKVKMMASEFSGNENLTVNNVKGDNNKADNKVKGINYGGEVGGFVLWQKRPDLWCLELVVSGTKISAGSDGKVAWRQTSWNDSCASRGPPRPPRRCMQGLDPRLTANLFTNSICIGEKTINDEDCFVLKLEANPSTLKARSSTNAEVIRHTMWGYFSQKTGLLVQIEDTHLLRLKASNNESIFWETAMESLIQDYRTIDGVNIAHSGKTSVSLFRYGVDSDNHSRVQMEEVWSIEEVDFNIKGLTMDCFLPPSELKKEDDVYARVVVNNKKSTNKVINNAKVGNGTAKVISVDEDYWKEL